MPFNYFDIEDAVITRLNATISGAAIISPVNDNEKEMEDDLSAMNDANRPLVTVIYNGSDFDPTASTNQVVQDDNINIICSIMFDKLRGDYGIHNTIRLLKDNLQGFKPANISSRLQLKSIQFIERNIDTGNFIYNVTFTCKKPQVQSLQDGEDNTTGLPNLNQLNYNETYN